jgi:hypothetical protein
LEPEKFKRKKTEVLKIHDEGALKGHGEENMVQQIFNW